MRLIRHDEVIDSEGTKFISNNTMFSLAQPDTIRLEASIRKCSDRRK